MRRVPHAPNALVSIALGALVVLGAAALGWHAARPTGVALPDRLAVIASADSTSHESPSETGTPIPDRALAAVLRIDLFPPPAPPPGAETTATRPEPPPRLDVELVAILITSIAPESEEGAIPGAGATSGTAPGVGAGAGVRRRAFLYDPKTQTYATLGVGDALREGVIVSAIDDESATFQIARGDDTFRSVRMELKQ